MQNRPAPAYQEYAAGMMASTSYRLLSLSERGLLYTMRLECWVNHGLPENPAALAKILGFDAADVAAALPSVMPFFRNEGGLITSPELDDYRRHLEATRLKQSEGGKQSAANKKGKSKSAETLAERGTQGKQVTCKSPATQVQVLSTVQTKPDQPSQKQSLEKGLPDECIPWAADYEKASNGR